jgi:hypothetical protein
MILDKFPRMDPVKIDFLSRATAGMFGEEIFKAVEDFEKNGKIANEPVFPYRNSITGEYPEKEINPFSLKKLLERVGFEASFIPHFCSESFTNLEMAVKRFYYWADKHLS